MRVQITSYDTLIVVDMQKDFMPGGALAVKEADTIIGRVNAYIKLFTKTSQPIFFTRDWHPHNHISFQDQGGAWPPHCVQGTQGAAFADGLYIPQDNRFIISKGTSQDFDAYSGFQGTLLLDLLQERGIKRVFICGVATDFCVKHTALGALHYGFTTFVLEDATKAVFDQEAALKELLKSGAIATDFNSISKYKL
ncbi:nicotinamidase [Nitratiruptor sp. YY09-18]|uniref:nicotinamidase n=1 Tax=Nitratiruptor sp. YY09-18 TaxID=2724901 RepID=UPI001915930C|nr:nicotinamidase [Nitratiruptor sp. YY09-18]BCD68273.1 nicotinamidase/pyrazinamidase [Nitratiruptor sp. YY09-18]